MTIPRVWANGLSDTANLTSTDMASLDANVHRAFDKTGGGTFASKITVASAGALSIDGGGSGNGFVVTGAASLLKTTSGGRIQYLNSSPTRWGTFSAARSFTRDASMQEMANFSADSGVQWNRDNSLGAMVPNAASSTLYCPISRAWDGATLSSITVYWIVQSARNADALPSFFPFLLAYRTDPSGITANLPLRLSDSGFLFSTPASMAAYINGGTPNALTYTCAANNIIDVSQFAYHFKLIDENYSGGFSSTKANRYLGYSLSYTNVNDMRPQ